MMAGTAKLLAKAERAIRAARTLLDAGDGEFAAGRLYYAMFYVAEALLFERGHYSAAPGIAARLSRTMTVWGWSGP